jgi:hypothetical protein
MKLKINFCISKVVRDNQGQLLLEILIAVGVAAVVLSIVSQLVLVSLNSNKATVESTIAENLAQEEFKAVEAIAFSKWQNLYNLTKASSSHYFATSTAGDWATSTGDEIVRLNSLSFTRYFTIANVCRDDVSRAIITTAGVPPCTAGNSDDPSTQKITVTVSWAGGSLTRSDHLTRWRNQTCVQTSWNSGGSTGTTTCPATYYDTKDAEIDASVPGSIMLQAN